MTGTDIDSVDTDADGVCVVEVVVVLLLSNEGTHEKSLFDWTDCKECIEVEGITSVGDVEEEAVGTGVGFDDEDEAFEL